MRVFTAVATLGSFAEAARRLRLSPSVVTRAIAQLEDRLQQTVLRRTTRSVKLTERGAAYLASCRQILDEVEVAERAVRGEDATPRGELTVAAPLVFGRLHALPVVHAVLAAHPGLSIRLLLSDRYAHLVDEGIDVAIRIGALADSSLRAVRVGAVSRTVVASPAYLRRRGTPDTPAALTAHDLIAFETTDSTHEWRFASSLVRIEPRLTVNSADAALAAAAAGLGITRALSYQIEAAARAGQLVPLLERHAPPALPVSVVHSPRRIPSRNVTIFVDAARAHFQAHPLVPVADWKIAVRPRTARR